MIRLWFQGLLRERSGRLAGAMAGVALTVALLATLAIFLGNSAASMTRRAIAGVPVDWQVLVVPGTPLTGVEQAIAKATPVAKLQPVGYADVAGFEARTGGAGGTVQTSGAGKVVGIEAAYASAFPGQLRPLLGSAEGVLIAQQTASNLHVAVGDGHDPPPRPRAC